MSGERVRTTMVEVPVLPGSTGDGLKETAQGESSGVSQSTSQSTSQSSGQSIALVEDDAQLWRPLYRPPMAVLWVLDDAGSSGEFIRLRQDEFTIGRESGDLIIPHDSKISGLHCKIKREVKDGEFRWTVVDEKSTNGTFVKVDEGLVRHEQEIYVGSRRYKFQAAPLAETSASGDRNEGKSGTQEWKVATVAQPEKFAPTLLDLTPDSGGLTYHLTGDSPQLGTDGSKCTVVIEGDPFLSDTHCQFIRRENGDWCIEDLGSKNGTWMRISQVRVRNSNMIMVGEQRLVIKQI